MGKPKRENFIVALCWPVCVCVLSELPESVLRKLHQSEKANTLSENVVKPTTVEQQQGATSIKLYPDRVKVAGMSLRMKN